MPTLRSKSEEPYHAHPLPGIRPLNIMPTRHLGSPQIPARTLLLRIGPECLAVTKRTRKLAPCFCVTVDV
jgi:hypothetical protein